MASGPHPLPLQDQVKDATEHMSMRNMKTPSLTPSSTIITLTSSVRSHSPILLLYSSRSLGMLVLGTLAATPPSPALHSSLMILSSTCKASRMAT
jgi:hypothetical protein